MTKRHTRAAAPPGAKPRGIPPASVKAAAGSATAIHPHHFEIPLWVVIAGFLIVEVALILVLSGGTWRYRTVIKEARTAMAEGRWQDALKYWAAHVRNFPGAESAIPFRRDRAQCYIGAGKHEAAMQDLEFILLNPDQKKKDPDVLQNLAECQVKLGRIDDASKTYEAILAISPSNAAANLFLGRQLLDQGKVLEAAVYLQGVPVEKYPEDLKAKWAPFEQRFAREAARIAGAEASSPTLSAPAEPGSASDRPASPSLAPTAAP